MRIGGRAFAVFAAAATCSAFAAPECTDSLAAARTFAAQRNWAEAERAIEVCLAASPNHAEAGYLFAHVQFQQGRYSAAHARISGWLTRNAETAAARKVEGLSLFMLGRQTDAQTALERAVALAPADTEARYYLGRLLFTAQQMPRALAEFTRVVEADPASVRGHNHLGQTLEALARFDDAAAAYRKAIALEKTQSAKSEWPYFNLGVLDLKNGRAADAIPNLVAAIARAPLMWEAHVQLAVALAAEDRLTDAEAELNRVLASAPDNADAHYQMGRLLTKMGKRDEAQKYFTRFGQLRNAAAAVPRSPATAESRP